MLNKLVGIIIIIISTDVVTDVVVFNVENVDNSFLATPEWCTSINTTSQFLRFLFF